MLYLVDVFYLFSRLTAAGRHIEIASLKSRGVFMTPLSRITLALLGTRTVVIMIRIMAWTMVMMIVLMMTMMLFMTIVLIMSVDFCWPVRC